MKRTKKDLELEFIYNELMMAQSLRLYRTVFKTKGEFNEVVETVLNQAEKIEPFNHKTLH